jgi:hypothetical protein
MVNRSFPGPFRFFFVIGLHPLYTLIVLGAVLAVGVATMSMQPAELDAGLGMVLFAQMFLASTGFVPRARQGHFDPLLAGASSRVRVAAAHWTVSILPGGVAWAVLAVMALLWGTPAAWSAMFGSRGASLVIVSASAWAAGFRLPRGAAGMLWMALLMGLVMQRADLLAVPAGSGSWTTFLLHTGTLILCPFLLLGTHPPLARGALAAAVIVPLVLLCAVCRSARSLDVYLVDRR